MPRLLLRFPQCDPGVASEGTAAIPNPFGEIAAGDDHGALRFTWSPEGSSLAITDSRLRRQECGTVRSL
jgi:hypothetical protein